MIEREPSREIRTPNSAEVAELYSLIHKKLEELPDNDDGHSRTASWSFIDSGMYKGYVQAEAINPLSELNNTGVCALISVGELERGEKVDFQDPEYVVEMRGIEHVVKNYFIYHTGSRLTIGVNTVLAKPSKMNTIEQSEELLQGDVDLGQMLNIVYEDEVYQLISELRSLASH